MARPKKQVKTKEPVKLRTKNLNNGNKSLYLDIYRDGVRKYEFLKMYLIPETTQAAKNQNAQVLAAANAIKSQMIIDLTNNEAGIKADPARGKITLREYLQIYEAKKKSKCTQSTIDKLYLLAHNLHDFGGENIQLKNIDADFCARFAEHLRTYKFNVKGKPARTLSAFTVNARFELFTTILNTAERDGVITENPVKKMNPDDKPHRPESTRTFLTIEEVKKLIETPAPRNDVKRAFLFSCFCGLRFSDVKRLQWGEIENNNGHYFARLTMQKTQEPLYLALSETALNFLPERTPDDTDSTPIFGTLTSNCVVNRTVHTWAAKAGIKKTVSFHVARHTFATTALTLGADLYTVSKLLGHSKIITTQIYAKVVNEKKSEAVDLFDAAFK